MSAPVSPNNLTYSRIAAVGAEESSREAPNSQWTNPAKALVLLEWIFAIAITCFAVALHIRFITHAGGLWRDEANSVELANLPVLKELWRSLDFDSFPLLFFGVLRGWTAIFGIENDLALRVLGGFIGLGILGALWLNARAFGNRSPVLSVALVGLNPMLIRYGDSTRAYGLGILLMLLTLWSFWRLVNTAATPSWKRVMVATACALLAVQCLYYNSVLLLAIAGGATAVALRARAWRTAVIISAIGMLAAVSLLVYAPMILRMHEWTFLVSYPVDLAWLWERVCDVIGAPDRMLIWLWVGLILTAMGIAGCIALRGFSRPVPPAVLFAGVALVIGVPGYAAFLRALNYRTQPWYYITLAALVACLLDVILGSWARRKKRLSSALLGVRLGAAALLLVLAGAQNWETLTTRQTNVDLLTARLDPLARKGDLVLVTQWEEAVSFMRYYRGQGKVITVPPIEDHRFHRYDLVWQQMQNPEALSQVSREVDATLKSGHTIWLVGGLLLVPKGEKPLRLPVDFDVRKGWRKCYTAWWQQTGYMLQTRGKRVVDFPVPVPQNQWVNQYEDATLAAVTGWNPAAAREEANQ